MSTQFDTSFTPDAKVQRRCMALGERIRITSRRTQRHGRASTPRPITRSFLTQAATRPITDGGPRVPGLYSRPDRRRRKERPDGQRLGKGRLTAGRARDVAQEGETLLILRHVDELKLTTELPPSSTAGRCVDVSLANGRDRLGTARRVAEEPAHLVLVGKCRPVPIRVFAMKRGVRP